MYPEASEVFAKLSMYPPVFGDEEKKVLERFVIIVCDRSSSATDIDSADWTCLPASRSRMMQYPQPMLLWNITQSVLLTKQAASRAKQQILSPSEWGWKQQDYSWQIVWTSLPLVAESCKQLTKCRCKTAC